jgi:hypothetical protein
MLYNSVTPLKQAAAGNEASVGVGASGIQEGIVRALVRIRLGMLAVRDRVVDGSAAFLVDGDPSSGLDSSQYPPAPEGIAGILSDIADCVIKVATAPPRDAEGGEGGTAPEDRKKKPGPRRPKKPGQQGGGDECGASAYLGRRRDASASAPTAPIASTASPEAAEEPVAEDGEGNAGTGDGDANAGTGDGDANSEAGAVAKAEAVASEAGAVAKAGAVASEAGAEAKTEAVVTPEPEDEKKPEPEDEKKPKADDAERKPKAGAVAEAEAEAKTEAVVTPEVKADAKPEVKVVHYNDGSQ